MRRSVKLGRATASAGLLFQLLQRRPLVSIATASSELKLSKPTVSKAIDALLKLGILKETTGMQKGRLLAYSRYLAILSLEPNRCPLSQRA